MVIKITRNSKQINIPVVYLLPGVIYVILFILDWMVKFNLSSSLMDYFLWLPPFINDYPILCLCLLFALIMCLIAYLFTKKENNKVEKIVKAFTPIGSLVIGVVISFVIIFIIGMYSIIVKNEFM